jgi:hypothetical protein
MLSGTTGGFEVTVTRTAKNERQIEAIGYAPSNAGPSRSRRKIRAIVEKLPDMALNAPCALCVKGDLEVSGTSKIDSYLDTTCGSKVGALSVGTLDKQGTSDIRGSTDGNAVWNQTTDYQSNSDPSVFDGITLTSNDFKTLRELAKANGTYFGPGYPDGTASSSTTWSGHVQFDSTHQLKNGIVFIDTVSGQDIPADISQQNPSDFASAQIQGNPFIGDSTDPGKFKGWIVVNGSLAISGNMTINGLVYVVNDLTYNGTGTGGINGLAVSQNIRDVTATAISTSDPDDSTTVGNSKVTFNCQNIRSPQFIPQNFKLKAGTWRELSD